MIQRLLAELKAGLVEIYGERLKGVYLYGSYARGEAGPESDVDVLVVLDSIERYGAEINRTGPLTAELSLRYGVSISKVYMSEREWSQGDSPFLATVREDAIAA